MRIFFITIWVSLILVSCKQQPLIVGNWKLDKLDIGVVLPPEQQKMFDESISEMKDHTKLTFKKDGTYLSKTMEKGEKRSETGIYKLENNVLKNESSKGEQSELQVIELTKEKLTVGMVEDGRMIRMFLIRD